MGAADGELEGPVEGPNEGPEDTTTLKLGSLVSSWNSAAELADTGDNEGCAEGEVEGTGLGGAEGVLEGLNEGPEDTTSLELGSLVSAAGKSSCDSPAELIFTGDDEGSADTLG